MACFIKIEGARVELITATAATPYTGTTGTALFTKIDMVIHILIDGITSQAHFFFRQNAFLPRLYRFAMGYGGDKWAGR